MRFFIKIIIFVESFCWKYVLSNSVDLPFVCLETVWIHKDLLFK